MKPLFHFLIVLILCISFSVIAKIRIPLNIPKTTPSPLPVKDKPFSESPITSSIKTYKQLRDGIVAMDSEYVVAQDGIFTDNFINFVKENVEKSQLSGVFAQALLQAGINLHISLGQDNAFTARALKRNAQQILDILNSLKPTLPARPHEKKVSKLPQQPIVPPAKKPQSELPIKSKPEPDKKPTLPLPATVQSQKLSGPAGLKEFRKQSSNKPIEAFYAHSKVSLQWLTKALHIVLGDQPLTTRNKKQIQHELVGNATELMRELLDKNHIASNAWHTFLENVTQQVIDFMNNQSLQDQKQLPTSLPQTKTPHIEPSAPQAKIPAFEPQPKSAQKPDIDPRLPSWITSQHTLAIKDLEMEILRYIFENQQASQEIIEQHFIEQVPKNIKIREILINGIKATVGKILQEPLEPELSLEVSQTSTQKTSSKNKLPYWIDAKGLNIKPSKLDQEIAKFIAGNMNADNDDIANHFINLIPQDMPHKRVIERQIRDTIEAFLAR